MPANIKEIDGQQFVAIADVELVKLAVVAVDTDDHRHSYFLARDALAWLVGRSILNRETLADIAERYKSTGVPPKMNP